MHAERRLGTLLGPLLGTLLQAGCDATLPVEPSAGPHQPWVLPESLRAQVKSTLDRYGDQPAAARGADQGSDPAALDPTHAYSRGELIDLAQRRNPATRAAWEQARQAALATGVPRATLLPRLAASVVGGYQRLSTPVTLPFGGTRTLTTDVQAVIPILTVEWLLFDFGERTSALEVTDHLATVARVQFNQAHQQVVFDVNRAFNAGGAAGRKEAAAGRALAAARQVLAAAETRAQRGVGTRIEIAQANTQLAQAQLSLVQAQGESATARVALNAALGTPHGTLIRLRDSAEGLPAATADSLDQVIARALVQRSDIVAGVAQLQAAQAGERGVAAAFRPKVGLIASLSTGDNQFSFNGGTTFAVPLQQTGVLIGVTLPLYEGGLRDSRLQSARSRILSAQAAVATTRGAAAAEIAAAYEALRSALAAYHAADVLVAAAGVGSAAARTGFEVGVGTLTDAAAADKALLDAENARADARRNAFDAAATLAFVTAGLTAEPP